jgi:hypothetical protein
MAELNTEQLQCMLTSLVTNCEHVTALGVFPADRVPIKVHVGANGARTLRRCADDTTLAKDMHYCFILNTHAHGEPGEHWLAFFYNCDTGVLEYFDSFGFALSVHATVYAALDACNLAAGAKAVNTAGMLQSLKSTVCGHYCVMYLYWRAKHCNVSPILFSRSVSLQGNATERDKYIVQRLRTLLSQHACQYESLTGGSMSQTCTTCRI